MTDMFKGDDAGLIFRHPLVPTLREAIADGFSNGNEQYDDASEPQQRRYDMAVYSALEALTKAGALAARGAGQGEATREAIVAQIVRAIVFFDADGGDKFTSQNAADAILALIPARDEAALPEGWVAVPREPTMVMIKAGAEHHAEPPPVFGPDGEDADWLDPIQPAWHAMLAAAPQAHPRPEGADRG